VVTRTFDYNPVVKRAYILSIDDHSSHRFIAERPALNLSALADELGIDRVNLHKIISGMCKIPIAKHGLFYKVAQNGWLCRYLSFYIRSERCLADTCKQLFTRAPVYLLGCV
jgi:hypothetical protein